MRFHQVVGADDGGTGNLATNGKKTPSAETADSHMGLMFATSKFIRQMRFHLPLFALTLLRTSQKPPQACVNTFFAN